MLTKKDLQGNTLALGILKHKYNPDADIDTFWTNMIKDEIDIANNFKYDASAVKSLNPFLLARYTDTKT